LRASCEHQTLDTVFSRQHRVTGLPQQTSHEGKLIRLVVNDQNGIILVAVGLYPMHQRYTSTYRVFVGITVGRKIQELLGCGSTFEQQGLRCFELAEYSTGMVF
jgi:hypothetical protein